MSQLSHIAVSIMGLGKVGCELISQILESRDVLAGRKEARIDIISLSDLNLNIRDASGLPDDLLRQVLEHRRNGRLLPDLPQAKAEFELPKRGEILVDITASDSTVETLIAALEHGCGVVLANKKPLCGPWQQAKKIFMNPNARWEVTVGAGLPVISTINYLRSTGDRVQSITGCLSGTLGYLCSRFQAQESYSQIVRGALALGYTEPDPRDDLSGMDVARKILILARTSGFSLEMGDVQIEALYPTHLDGVPLDEFMARLGEADEEYAQKVSSAAQKQEVLRYIAQVHPDGGSASLEGVQIGSMPSVLNGPESFISITTDRYAATPLVVIGPGAGPAVTAAGVYGDIIDLGLQLD